MCALFKMNYYCFNRLETDDELFTKYKRNFRTKALEVLPECDEECRADHVCGMLSSSYDKYDECMDLKTANLTTTQPPGVTQPQTSVAVTHPVTTPTKCPPCRGVSDANNFSSSYILMMLGIFTASIL